MKKLRNLFVAAALIAGGAFTQAANAQDPVALGCRDCANYSQLQTEASQYANRAPYPANGTKLLIVSGKQNLAAYFQVGSYMVCSYYTPQGYPYATYCNSGGTVVRYATAITPSPAEAAALDEVLFAKNVGSVRIDPEYGSSYTALAEDVNSGLRQVVPILPGNKIVLNGKTIKLIPDVSTIEVVFADGSKIKLVFKTLYSTIAWVVVSRTSPSGVETPETNSGGSSSGGGAATPPTPNPQPPPMIGYCPIQVISYVCIEEVGSTGACPASNSGQVTVYLRPCGY